MESKSVVIAYCSRIGKFMLTIGSCVHLVLATNVLLSRDNFFHFLSLQKEVIGSIYFSHYIRHKNVSIFSYNL